MQQFECSLGARHKGIFRAPDVELPPTTGSFPHLSRVPARARCQKHLYQGQPCCTIAACLHAGSTLSPPSTNSSQLLTVIDTPYPTLGPDGMVLVEWESLDLKAWQRCMAART